LPAATSDGPGGWLAVAIATGGVRRFGEIFFDPDFVRFPVLEARATAAGFAFDRKVGGSPSYLARFRPA